MNKKTENAKISGENKTRRKPFALLTQYSASITVTKCVSTLNNIINDTTPKIKVNLHT